MQWSQCLAVAAIVNALFAASPHAPSPTTFALMAMVLLVCMAVMSGSERNDG